MADGIDADLVNATSIKSARPSSMVADRLAADLSSININAPLPNFPIPRELRDQIYGYLLDSEYTRISRRCDQVPDQEAKPNRSGPKAYHFHTNILAVNRQIHDETEELLYKRNVFVVISYQWPADQAERGSLIWTPIVSNKHVARMALHSLRIHMSPGPITLQAAELNYQAKVPIESYLILAGDMKAFAVSLQIPEKSHNGHAVSLARYPGRGARLRLEGLQIEDELRDPSRMKFQLRDTRHRKMNHTLQDDLLSPLASVVDMGQKVSFTGAVCDSKQAEHLRKMMGPSVVCVNAMYWSAYKECAMAKDVADAALEHEDFEFVVCLYRHISRRLAKKLGVMRGHREMLEELPTFTEIYEAIDLFTVEFQLNLAFAELKLGRVESFRDACDEVQAITRPQARPDHKSMALTGGVLDQRRCSLVYLCLYASTGFSVWPEYSVADVAREFLYSEDTGPYQTHDGKVLAHHPHQNAVMTAEHLPLDQCAATCLPFAPTSFYKAVKHPTLEGRLKGWIDVHDLRSLCSKDKDEIRAMQKEHGLEMTDFTQF